MTSRVLRALFALLLLVVPLAAAAGTPENRMALVIGNAAYKAGALATPANDAALVAESLRMQGFDVTASRDLDAKRLQQAFEQFRNKIVAPSPGSIIVIYFAGLGLQLEGDNYLIPVDATPTHTSDIRRDGVQLSVLIRSLAELGPKAAFVILDAARKNPFSIADGSLAGGFAWVEPENNFLVALSAAPGTIASDNSASFSPYAVALAEMFRQEGLSSGDLFARVRLRVNEMTNGGQVPWHGARLENSFVLAKRPYDAPQRDDKSGLTRPSGTQLMRTLSAGDAYFTALTRDTFDGYSEFLAEYWKDPMTSRVRALLAARREVLTWHRSTQTSTANAYWTYLERYPRGPHVADAQRWLTRAGVAVLPPSNFARMEIDVPAPLPDERQYVERIALNFGDPDLAFEPPLPVPNHFLRASTSPPRRLAAPGGAIGDGDLPALAPASPANTGVPVAGAPPLPKQTEQSNDMRAQLDGVANLTAPVPASARPASANPMAGATITTPATPAAAAVPWIAGGSSDQSAPSWADMQGPATRSPAPSASSGKPISDTRGQFPSADADAGRPAPDPSNRTPRLEVIPLPSPRPVERGPRMPRRTVQAANPGASRAGSVAASGGSTAATSVSGRTPELALRPSLEAVPTRVTPLRPINGGPLVTGAIPRTRPVARMGKPMAQPAKKPATGALSETPAAVAPAD